MTAMALEVPPHFLPETVGEVWRVDYERRAEDAESWARAHAIGPAADDRRRVALLAVDVQITFCTPGFELFVGGRSGVAAVDDNRRLCAFIYRNLDAITRIHVTMDTHQAMQIFHATYLVDDRGRRPAPYTTVSVEDVESGRWRIDPLVARSLGIEPEEAAAHLLHYVRTLEAGEKYRLTVWPYHAMLGGIGHALVPAVEEAIFFHGLARSSHADFQVKGRNPFTEHYSILGPEVTSGPGGSRLASKNAALIDTLLDYDAVVIAGQAKSHCVAWTVADLLDELHERDPRLAGKFYLLEDCTSPVVVPGGSDFTAEADAAFERFADAGMHVVHTTEPLGDWPDLAPAP
jgi:nicotinamidase-related amidase